MKIDASSILPNIATITGSVTAGTGIVHFLNANASVIGILFTGLTFLVFLGSKVWDGYLKRAVANAKIKAINGD